VLRNPMVLIDPDRKQIRFSNDKDIRNEQLGEFKKMFDPEYANNITITTNDAGLFILDKENFKSANIENNELYNDILFLASGNEMVSFNLVEGGEVINNVIEEATNEPLPGFTLDYEGLGGYTFPSGNVENVEQSKYKPIINEENKNFKKPETVLLVKRYSKSNEEKTVSNLAHELTHAAKYARGKIWSYEYDRPFLYKDLKKAEETAAKSCRKWNN